MITLTLVICVVMILLWLGLESLGVIFTDCLGWFLFLAATLIVLALFGMVSRWFKK